MDGFLHFRALDGLAGVLGYSRGDGAIVPVPETLPSQSVVCPTIVGKISRSGR
ncbi:Uncharacterised protein [Streptococcus suis]|uniref:Uncharacterized protein n=1 Tax=Streptococcus suis TaxID=1307 RepID=A0A0Z8GQH5_STRSU|nr:Uncharacterised protein [Streptococcus suis]CYU71459.1 Uncharacterised protein [Streptococcus suis]CYU74418.1 Uncharacterised protein [Streptococcus suis]CYU89961.1 Uncharacterised protein [Streptococcus suis]CYV03026.1 Uncharacterised protein [Streptococcus suis]